MLIMSSIGFAYVLGLLHLVVTLGLYFKDCFAVV